MTPREQELQDRVEELEGLLGVRPPLEAIRPFGMTYRTAQVFGVLLNSDIATREFIFTAVWGGNSESDDPILNVQICKIRKHLDPLGVKIENIYGVGYRIPADDRKRLKAMLERE